MKTVSNSSIPFWPSTAVTSQSHRHYAGRSRRNTAICRRTLLSTLPTKVGIKRRGEALRRGDFL